MKIAPESGADAGTVSILFNPTIAAYELRGAKRQHYGEEASHGSPLPDAGEKSRAAVLALLVFDPVRCVAPQTAVLAQFPPAIVITRGEARKGISIGEQGQDRIRYLCGIWREIQKRRRRLKRSAPWIRCNR